jgi:hypothetical protein
VGSSAKINQVTALIGSHFTAISDFRGDERNFEWVIRKEFESLFLGQDQSVEGLGRGDNFLCGGFDLYIVFFGKDL